MDITAIVINFAVFHLIFLVLFGGKERLNQSLSALLLITEFNFSNISSTFKSKNREFEKCQNYSCNKNINWLR